VSRYALAMLVTLVIGACSKSEAAAEPAGGPARPMLAALGATHETENYKVTIEAPGPYKKGVEGKVNVVLTTKGDYHINKQYPYKFTCQDPPAEGVSYPKPVVRREDGTFEERKAVLAVPFVANRAGEVKVGGVFSLSVCTDANCLMDKAPIEITVKIED